MDIAVGLFTIIAGAAYIMWQYHKENPGMLTMTLLVVIMVCAPLAFWQWIMNDINLTAGIIGLFTHVGVLMYLLFSPRIKKAAEKDTIESVKIWEDVNALPIPDNDVLRQYKIANKIPLYPADSKVFNDQAIKLWRISEYNKRYTAKHKFVYYQKI